MKFIVEREQSEVLTALQGKTKYQPLTKQEFLLTHEGWTDRRFRMAIAELREDGYCIVSNSGTIGYWITDRNSEDFKIFERQMLHRIMRISNSLKAMKGYSIEGQEVMKI